jgi:purine nucleoside phosphorylase
MSNKLAMIMRSDKLIEDFNLQRVTIDTSFGPVDRCYAGKIFNTEVLMIYGRFNGQKVPSNLINYQQNIEVVKNAGFDALIGTFVVGGIKHERFAGSTYIIKDIVGMGNYDILVNMKYPFHNAEMFEPFCENLYFKLVESSERLSFCVISDAVYVCFHGWPRIETKAELDFYEKMGWDVVGQTCDPEATLARLNGLCYAAVAVQIDDPLHRGKSVLKKSHTTSIKEYRKKTEQVVLEFLKTFDGLKCSTCCKLKRSNSSFREFPEVYYE